MSSSGERDSFRLYEGYVCILGGVLFFYYLYLKCNMVKRCIQRVHIDKGWTVLVCFIVNFVNVS